MIPDISRTTAAAVAVLLLTACGSVPLAPARRATDELLAPRLATTAAAESELHALLAQPLGAATAVRIALLRNPAIQIQYTRLDLAAADVFDATRLRNPMVGIGMLWPLSDGGQSQITGSLTWPLGDWLQLKSRRSAGNAEFTARQQQVAAAIYTLSIEVQEAWLAAVEAQQRQVVRLDIAESAGVGAELAAQYRAAGNLDALSVALLGAAGSEATLGSQRSRADLARASARLRQLLGLTAVDPPLRLPTSLPAPGPVALDRDALSAQARSQRLDLQAARSEVALQELRATSTRRFRWFAGGSVGAIGEREEVDGDRAGATLALPLPIFQQQQGDVVRSNAELTAAQLRVRQIEIAIDAEIEAELQQMTSAEAQYRECRETLIPQRGAAVARLTERGNFMLSDPFPLLLARQQEYGAYEDALLALRDYWRSRIALARALGAPLISISTEPQS